MLVFSEDLGELNTIFFFCSCLGTGLRSACLRGMLLKAENDLNWCSAHPVSQLLS